MTRTLWPFQPVGPTRVGIMPTGVELPFHAPGHP
jgi:hypothetical protein